MTCAIRPCVRPLEKRLKALIAGVLLATAVMLVLGACSTNPATGERSFTAFMSPEEEARIGADEHPKVLAQFGGVYDEGGIGTYVSKLGDKLLEVSETPDAPFRFTVLDSDVVNAFALPGGYVYISRGLIALAENEAELASVIGHEIGHVTARHTAQRYSQAAVVNIGLSIIGILGSVAGVPTEANDLLSAGTTVILQGYSREQELEADMLGIRYMSRAGYDPDAARSFFEKMAGEDELRARMTGTLTGEEAFNFTSSHPRTSRRIEQAIDLGQSATVTSPVLNREDFLREIDGMVFGDSPTQGIRRDRTFSHADLGITFTVPPGYTMQNKPTRIVALHPDGGQMIFDGVRAEVARRIVDLRRYLINEWGQDLGLQNLRDVQRMTINGLEAWTGQGWYDTRKGEHEIRLIVIRYDADTIYRFVFTAPSNHPDDQGMWQRTADSFRRLSQDEIDNIRPLRVRTKMVTDSDTLNSLQQGMAIDQLPAAWFDLINDVALADGLQAGEQIKLIAE